MAGMECPKCKELTFFKKSTGRECSKCGYTMNISANNGKGGKGKKCSNCGEYKVFNEQCRGCGATYT